MLGFAPIAALPISSLGDNSVSHSQIFYLVETKYSMSIIPIDSEYPVKLPRLRNKFTGVYDNTAQVTCQLLKEADSSLITTITLPATGANGTYIGFIDHDVTGSLVKDTVYILRFSIISSDGNLSTAEKHLTADYVQMD